MSVYTKNNEGKVTKIAGMITQRLNTRWFLCTRSLADGIEYYTVPADAQSYFKNLDAFTIYSFGFNEPNTTLSPKLRYGNTVLDIRDFTNEGGGLVIGQLSGVYQMFTQDLNNDPKIYFVGTTHPDAIDAEVSTTSTNAVQNQAITKYANDLLLKASKIEIDNTSITKNTQEQIQAVGVMDETNSVNKVHSTLTKEQFDALTKYDEHTFYPITDETGVDSIGGATGDITLGTGLSIENNVLSASGGGEQVEILTNQTGKTILQRAFELGATKIEINEHIPVPNFKYIEFDPTNNTFTYGTNQFIDLNTSRLTFYRTNRSTDNRIDFISGTMGDQAQTYGSQIMISNQLSGTPKMPQGLTVWFIPYNKEQYISGSTYHYRIIFPNYTSLANTTIAEAKIYY